MLLIILINLNPQLVVMSNVIKARHIDYNNGDKIIKHVHTYILITSSHMALAMTVTLRMYIGNTC